MEYYKIEDNYNTHQKTRIFGFLEAMLILNGVLKPGEKFNLQIKDFILFKIFSGTKIVRRLETFEEFIISKSELLLKIL